MSAKNPLEDVGLAKVRGGAFYLHGEDEFRKEEVVRALMEVHLDPATRDFNLDPLRGTETDPETLASVIATPPLMAEWRVVVVREVEGLAQSSRARDVVLDALRSPPPGLALILSCTVPQGSRAKFYKEMAKLGRALEFPAITPDDVPGWLMERARERYGMEVDVDAAQAMGSAVGVNLGVLAMELEKLADFVGDRGTLTVADIEAAGTSLPAQDRWRWIDLVGEGRLEEAVASLPVLLAQGDSGVSLTIALAQHLLRLGILIEDGPRALEASLPPHQKWVARRMTGQVKAWRAVEIEAALEGLLRLDRLAKSAPLSDEHLLEEWLLTLMARKVAA